jgi:hypothetical protein
MQQRVPASIHGSLLRQVCGCWCRHLASCCSIQQQRRLRRTSCCQVWSRALPSRACTQHHWAAVGACTVSGLWQCLLFQCGRAAQSSRGYQVVAVLSVLRVLSAQLLPQGWDQQALAPQLFGAVLSFV